MKKEVRNFTRLDKNNKVPIKVGNEEVVLTSGKTDIAITKEEQ